MKNFKKTIIIQGQFCVVRETRVTLICLRNVDNYAKGNIRNIEIQS